MSNRRSVLASSVAIPFRLVLIMWIIFIIQNFYGLYFIGFGILPRDLFGLIGIITAPWIHGNYTHLISNTFPLLFLGTTLFIFYPRIAPQVFFQCYIYTGCLVWLLARQTYHIGASGVVYGLAFFLIFIGFFRKDFKSLAISIIVVFLYGGLFYGLLPTQPGVSFESHLFGGITGTFSAIYFSKSRKTNVG